MAIKTTDKQQIHVVTDANFNHNKLINAKIDAKENEITNLPSGGNVDDVKVNNTSVVENKIASINLKTINRQSIVGSGNIDVEGGGSELNEFVITQEIFDEYKNENDYADLADIIDSEEITQKVINLNNFNYFLTGLVVSNKTLLFKNGTIVLGTSGINDSINNAITLSNSKLGFKDCEIIVNDSITTEPEKSIMDLNNTDLTFDNVIADNFTFTTFKTFIQTTNTCNIVLKDTLFDIIDKLINYDPEEDERRPSMKFIKILTNGSSVKFINSMVGISTENLIGEDINPGLCQNIIVETIGLATVKLEILNSILQLHAEGGHGEGGISSRPPRCLDINLDNLDIILIDSLMSCFGSDGFNVRPESSYGLEPNKSFTTNDPYMVFFEPSIDIFQGDDEAEDYEPKFENINIDKYLFINTIEYIEGDYHFTYNGSGWDVTANSFDEDDTIIRTLDTDITIEQIEEKYGLTFNLIEGKVLEQGDDITLELVLKNSYYKILENFTAESNSEEYFNELNYNIGEVTDLAEEIETVNYDNEKFANALVEVLERNGKHLKPHSEYDEEQDIETDIMAKIGFWYDEDNGDPNVWKIEIDPEWIEEDRHLMDDVDLRDFGLEVIIKDGQEIHNLSGFTVVVEPKVESTTVSIKENTNSVITGNPFEEDFPWLENKQPLGMFSTELVGFSQVKSIQTENIKTNNISVSDEYYLPVDNENLKSNNVKDAINELANREISTNNLFDIKTILTADAETNKGWACTCYDEPHKLNEEQVAQAYHEIENMLNQTVETKIELTNKTDVNMNVTNMLYADGWYYYVIGNGTNAVVKRSDNVDGENLEDVVNVGEELNSENSYSLVVCNCIERDDKIYFMFYFADDSFGSDYTLLYDKDWNLVVKYISGEDIMPYMFGSNAVFGKNEYSNKIFIPSVVNDFNDPEGSIASVRLIIYDINSGNYEVILKSLLDSSFNSMSTQTSFYDNKIWISTSSQVISIDLDNNYNIFINTELIPSNPTGFTTGMTFVNTSIINEEETIDTLYFIYSDTTNENSFFKILRYNDDNVWEEVYYDEGDANEYNYVTDVKNYNGKTIISTGNNIYISRNLNDIESLYQINNAGDLIINDNILSVKGTVNSDGYSYFDIEENKIEFTDTYNINGESVEINYYKSGEYKICEAGQNNRDDGEDENDSKLQDVYDYLGYLPYFWIDTENLDIVLPRNSNRWTMMYVGNNYIEEEMPEGNYSAFATKDELKKQFKIFDIKTISEPMTQKGWSCISYPTQNKLNKADVPTAYEFLKEKYNGIDSEASDTPTTIISGYAAYHCIDVDNDYLYTTNDSSWNIKRTLLSNLPLTNWENLNIQVSANNTGIGLGVGDNLIVALNHNAGKVNIYKKSDFTLYKELTIQNQDKANITKAFIDNKKFFFIAYYNTNNQYCLAKIEDSLSSDIEVLTTSLDGVSSNVVQVGNNSFIFCCNGKIYKTENNFQTHTQISTTTTGSADAPSSLYKINNVIVATGEDSYTSGYKISIDNGETWSNGTSFVNISGVCPNGWCDGKELYVFVHVLSWSECFLYHTGDLINWERIGTITTTARYPLIVKDKNNNIFYHTPDYYDLKYIGIIKTIYTDTINGTNIKYYKNGDWKICTPDIATGNDDNLQSVYEYLGYLNYWWIDTTNEQITLQRNSNMWTMMYVGDDYDYEVENPDTLPSGNYLPFTTKPIKLTNITASNWIEDDTFEDYGYKCEIECEGVNGNMFAQVVFSIEEANSGNYASVCDTAENKVIIYSKVNDTITIPTIVIMEA